MRLLFAKNNIYLIYNKTNIIFIYKFMKTKLERKNFK